ncbi:hypothetical protein [Glycomyces rhizosphaerae]|uniref:Uncharacterized protein n=1 Tax=Glycomyces rhizosphaerae TaxID=2054422 RepID=A0ABV7PUW2_9ACTN
MNERLDLDKVTTKEPDNHKIDKRLRGFGNDPDNLEATCDRVPEDGIDHVLERISQSNGGLSTWLWVRPRKLTYSFGPQHPVGAGFINQTNRPAEKELGWTDKVGTKTDFSVSASASASVLGLFTASITTSFGMEWSTEKTFSDSFKISLDPGEYGWLTRRGMTCSADVDFIFPGINFFGQLQRGYTWRATIEGYAGNDGRPDSWITGHAQKVDPSLYSLFEKDPLQQFVQAESDGLLIHTPAPLKMPAAV